MRKVFLGVCFVLLWACSGSAGSHSAALWDEANEAYTGGDFGGALVLYDSLENSGMVSAKLYYNKGNALFKMGKTGPAILYYAKAQRLSPSDNDITHNLRVASSHTRNRIEPVPELFLKRWFSAVGTVFSANGWAWMVLVFFVLTLAGLLVFLLPFSRLLRRVGFYGGLFSAALFVATFVFAQRAYAEAINPTEGVVMSNQAAVKSSPDSGGTDLFVLYEGDLVRVTDTLGEWSEITVANGNRGWVRSSAFELID